MLTNYRLSYSKNGRNHKTDYDHQIPKVSHLNMFLNKYYGELCDLINLTNKSFNLDDNLIRRNARLLKLTKRIILIKKYDKS